MVVKESYGRQAIGKAVSRRILNEIWPSYFWMVPKRSLGVWCGLIVSTLMVKRAMVGSILTVPVPLIVISRSGLAVMIVCIFCPAMKNRPPIVTAIIAGKVAWAS
ncbi:MAG TPA: hypothetical protein DDW41_00050 [Candidatus Andersenbacteria bacterium]|nr:hypothetical protein [Candidatus Andersenbacteria bacterium]